MYVHHMFWVSNVGTQVAMGPKYLHCLFFLMREQRMFFVIVAVNVIGGVPKRDRVRVRMYFSSFDSRRGTSDG